MSIVIIYGQDKDYHINAVRNELYSLGIDTILLEKYNEHHSLTHKFINGSYKTIVKINNKRFDLEKDFVGFLWRPKPETNAEKEWVNCTKNDIYKVQEWNISSQAIYYLNNSLKTVNPIECEIKMENKIYSMKLACECGLKIPNTVFTDDCIEIYDLNDEDIIYKHLSCFFAENGKTQLTQRYKLKDIDCQFVKIMPRIYQQYIDKLYELRVFVIKDQIFSVKIDSQLYEETKLDWRAMTEINKNLFSEFKLSQDTSRFLINYHMKSKLIYAAYDFIIDKSGNEIFLECNPSGNWLFVGENLASPITKSIANALLC